MKEKCMRRTYQKGFGKGFGKAAVLSYLFYRSLPVSLLAGVMVGVYSAVTEKERFRKEQCREITLQFKDGLQSISSALGAGYSIENAFGEARKELILLYGKEALLVGEFDWIAQQLSLSRPMEEVLLAFAQRWQAEDILHFAQVFQTAKRTGGNLIAITSSTAEKISQKLEVKREINTMIAGKKMEGRIMNSIPLGIIVYFWICSPGFLDCLYAAQGRVVMTVLLFLYVFACKWSQHISDICV